MEMKEIFSVCKSTENGDLSYTTTGNKYLDILFLTEYFRDRTESIPTIGDSDFDKLFAMFIRDPRFGVGARNVGRVLMTQAGCNPAEFLFAGRADDLCKLISDDYENVTKEEVTILEFLKKEIEGGNELVKKWMPRYSSKNVKLARKIAKCWGMNKQTYGHFIKANTVEQDLSRKNYDNIVFEHLPSLASIKYSKLFSKKEELVERYIAFLEKVKKGESAIHTSTSTPYDICKMLVKGDALDLDIEGICDTFFNQLPKIKGNWIPIIDTSSSMFDSNDSYYKAVAIGHYLAKCSTYMPDYVIPFSSSPSLIKLGEARSGGQGGTFIANEKASNYANEIRSIHTGDCSNTDLGLVMKLLMNLDKTNVPEFLIILSDMEFDSGSSCSKDELMKRFNELGVNTKIIWWNFNSRRITVPELDSYGNIFTSGYNPRQLAFLEAGFDGEKFLKKLIQQYSEVYSKVFNAAI